ncbi:MAG: DMT family transporter [Rhodocyclaceae bacterium]
MTRSDSVRGAAVMAAVVLIWGSFLPVSKVVLTAIDPYWLTLLRYGVAAAVFLALTAAVEGRSSLATEGHGAVLFLAGASGFCGFSLFVFEGLERARPEHGAMILALVPLWVVIAEWIATRRRPRAVVLACIAAALAGEALVVTRGDLSRLGSGGDHLGNALILLASLFWTAYTLGMQRFPGWSPLRYSALAGALGWLAVAAATLIATALGHAAPPPAQEIARVAWPLAYLVSVVSILAVFLWNTAVRLIGPLSASLFANFAPVVTFAIVVLQGQTLTAAEVGGAALVLAALVANNLYRMRLLRGMAPPFASRS